MNYHLHNLLFQEFLKDSPGFNLEKDGSLKVNDQFKVEGLDDVFAIGTITIVFIATVTVVIIMFNYYR